MSKMFGIHRLMLVSGVKREKFEKFMSETIFPAAAEAQGSINRAGQSAIKSQHLLKAEGNDTEYLWVVKDSGIFTSGFTGIFEQMYDAAREQLEPFVTRESSVAFVVLDGFDAGPRGVTGHPLTEPIRGADI